MESVSSLRLFRAFRVLRILSRLEVSSSSATKNHRILLHRQHCLRRLLRSHHLLSPFASSSSTAKITLSSFQAPPPQTQVWFPKERLGWCCPIGRCAYLPSVIPC